MIEAGAGPEDGAAAPRPRSAAEQPWCGGRPWTPPPSAEPGAAEPRPDLCGIGVELARGLAVAAAELRGPELTTVGERARGHLVDVAVAAERVMAWASAVQAQAVAGLLAQFQAEDDLDQHDLDQHDLDQRALGAGGG